jgi:hypothetical protein
MKSHELARALSQLAQLLRKLPSVDLDDLVVNARNAPPPDPETVPVALSTLVSLSRFDRNQWLQLIKEYNFPVEIRARDASRDILGKILKHLEESPEARNRLVTRATKSKPESSPELLRALETLLRR